MKNNLDEMLTPLSIESSGEVDTDDFLKKLHGKIEEKKQNRKVFNTSVVMLIAVLFFSYTKIGITQASKVASYHLDESYNLFKTDFWNIDVDSGYVDGDYSNELAYFLLKEGDLWETVELFNEILLNEEES